MKILSQQLLLNVEPLIFERRWSLTATALSAEQLASLQKEFSVDYAPGQPLVHLTKRVTGHMLVTNYDPSLLSNQERMRLNEAADQGLPNEIAVDIRAGYPGGEWPLHGSFRLRSFHNVLNFIGQDIAEDSEYDVEKHPHTPPVRENPVHTMEVSVADDEPSDADVSIGLNGRYYSVKPESGHPWNREAFRLLSQVFQMTMTELPQFGVPGITISK